MGLADDHIKYEHKQKIKHAQNFQQQQKVVFTTLSIILLLDSV